MPRPSSIACLMLASVSMPLTAAPQGGDIVKPIEQKQKKDADYLNIFYYPAGEEEQAAIIQQTQLDIASSRAQWLSTALEASQAREADAQQKTREALLFGVTELPCVILCYKGIPYARLYGKDINATTIARAEARAKEAQSLPASYEARLASTLYLFHTVPLEQRPLEEVQRWVRECRALAASEECSIEQQQFLRLTYIYPLLLREFTLLYQGGHTPETEEKFLEAVGELELARDLAPTSRLGRSAYTIRETLRKARLQAKIYD